MPFALIVALLVSVGLHVAVLFWANFPLRVVGPDETLVIHAKLNPLPPQPLPQQLLPPKPVPKPERVTRKTPVAVPKPKPSSRRRVLPADPPVVAAPSPVVSSPAVIFPEPDESRTNEALSGLSNVAEAPGRVQVSPEASAAMPEGFRLPPRGVIRFRVERGDSNFEIGSAYQEWEFDAGRYRLRSVVKTTGLVGLFYSVRFEMESLGQFSEKGLQPEVFGILRDDRRAREKALFDWERMMVRVRDRPEQALDSGAQDLLSLYYQLGFLNLTDGQETALPVATGKKYGAYQLEVVGDEQIDVPMGSLRTRHIRAPGDNTTELWLAYDYLMLPVKIRHTDSKGIVLVQVATEIKTGR